MGMKLILWDKKNYSCYSSIEISFPTIIPLQKCSLPSPQIIEVLLSSLNQHMDAQRRPIEEYECESPTKSSPTLLYDPLSSSQGPNFAAPKPSGKDSVLKTYQVCSSSS